MVLLTMMYTTSIANTPDQQGWVDCCCHHWENMGSSARKNILKLKTDYSVVMEILLFILRDLY